MNKRLPSRNELCACGSGKKYKKCCLSSVSVVAEKLSPELYLRKAHSFMAKGEILSAEVEFKEALKSDKNSIDGLVGLGQCLCQQWRNDEGISLLLRAGKILLRQARKTKDVRWLLDLAYLMINLKATAKALPLIDGALAIAPRFPRGHHTKALALQKTSVENALISSKRAVELAPNEGNAVILLATLEAKQGDLITAKQRLQALLGSGLGIDSARAMHELGVTFDKLGDYSQAFCCFREAGELNLQKPEVKRIDKEAVFLDIKRNKQVFDEAYLSSCGEKINDQLQAPVFLIGFYRSGTTLIEQVLAAHPKVVSSDEAYLIPVVAKEIVRISKVEGCFQDKVKALSKEQIAELRQFYWLMAEQLIGETLSGKVFVDKTAMNTLNLGLINTLFPEATVLFALRDPRDVVLSCFMQSFTLSPLTVHFLGWVAVSKFYVAVMGYWLHVRDQLAVSWMELRYEDVVKDMEGQFRPVFDKLGLEWVAECEQFYQYAREREISTPSYDQVTQPIYQSSVQRWLCYDVNFLEITGQLDFFVQQFEYKGGGGAVE